MQAAAAKLHKLFTPGAPRATTGNVPAENIPQRPPLGFQPLPAAALAEPLLPLAEAQPASYDAPLSFNRSPWGAAARTVRASVASFLDQGSALALAATSRKNHQERLGALHERYGTALPAARDYLKCVTDIDEVSSRIRARTAGINLAKRPNVTANSNLHALEVYQSEDKEKLESLEGKKDRLQAEVDKVLKCQIDQGMHQPTVMLRISIDAALRHQSPGGLVDMYASTFRDAIATAPLVEDAQRLTDDLDSIAHPGTASILHDSLAQLVSTLDERLRAEACIAVVHWADVQPVASTHQPHGLTALDEPD